MARPLKVFRTPIGFHDAYVAAPSQKAALDAWGTDANLFARGMAEIVTDPELTREPLAVPGKVIKRARGTAAQHLAALPRTSTSAAKRGSPNEELKARHAKPKPKPSRRKLDAAELALERAADHYSKEGEAIRRREESLQRERRALNTERDEEIAELQRKLDHIRSEYDRALDEWRG